MSTRQFLFSFAVGVILGMAAHWAAIAFPQASSARATRVPTAECFPAPDVWNADRLRQALEFLQERYSVTLYFAPDVAAMAAMTGMSPREVLRLWGGRTPAVLYDYAPMGGCMIFDFYIPDLNPGGFFVVIRPADGSWKIVYERLYPIDFQRFRWIRLSISRGPFLFLPGAPRPPLPG